MTPEVFLQNKAAQAIQSLYGATVNPADLQVQVTRKEFEGDYTLVVFPLLRISHSAPEPTGNAIGAYL
ncbi:MAG: arginine--tRNA ligase, partial [Bacteroidales bacterium]|nr:arginine--tRNA ligase [Bacteroidales bacterium]